MGKKRKVQHANEDGKPDSHTEIVCLNKIIPVEGGVIVSEDVLSDLASKEPSLAKKILEDLYIGVYKIRLVKGGVIAREDALSDLVSNEPSLAKKILADLQGSGEPITRVDQLTGDQFKELIEMLCAV